jgi:hypothetical protein
MQMARCLRGVKVVQYCFEEGALCTITTDISCSIFASFDNLVNCILYLFAICALNENT